MIIYNVGREWFEFKNDAEASRKKNNLPADSLFKLEVNDRMQLAALLNALCGAEPVREAPELVVEAPAPVEVVQRAKIPDEVPVPDFVPLFLIKDEKQRARVQKEREKAREEAKKKLEEA